MSILQTIAAYARARTEAERRSMPLEAVRAAVLDLPPRQDRPFEDALRRPGVSFICECKKASPSKGIIAEHFDCPAIAEQYERAGADAISILTEPKWFLGSDSYLEEAAARISLPILRKDFVVDEYMIYRARSLGASCVLLICAILSTAQLRDYLALCDELSLSALVEAHDQEEIESAISAGARIIGVNNRDLRDLSVDTGNSRRLRTFVPEGTIFVSESGIKTAADVEALRSVGVDAVLVGEALMRADDKRAMLAELRGAGR